ncbi:sugar transferase [Pseudoroseicyclus tamaricis]|uniref:sugar transferase n=1 Tax=Pseudoroseicyclus tamaricis TaxID=2705421 RepID=UPI002E285F27|nr:sugar transferase [Pseudoroseicyclus tamaricis]
MQGRVYPRYVKRLTDLVLALLILPIVGPVILVLALMTRRDGGPSFFGHQRIGKDGQTFRCWKVRTMVPNAQEKLKEYLAENPEAAAEWAADFKLRNDPRITKIGRFLRKTSLDELPQLWNVLKGEMSFVGPRPVIDGEIELYGVSRSYYESVRPGITGLWQVSGRNDTTYSERVAMDRAYVRKMSFFGDLGIILKTAKSVLGSTGI